MADEEKHEVDDFKSGFAALVGRPNVGKSTLLNRLVGSKVSITSHKPQTTRNRVIGIVNGENWQIAFVDTPGIHRPGRKQLNRVINRNALAVVDGVDVVIMMIDASGWRRTDEPALKAVAETSAKRFLVINKIDTLDKRERLLPLIGESNEKLEFDEILPVCATRGTGTEELLSTLVGYLPEMPAGYPEDQITDRNIQFQSSELIREQLFRQLNDEVPYATAVTIDTMEKIEEVLHIEATIWVENDSQKPIVIGKKGERLKRMASQARAGLERIVAGQVFLQVWVKVRKGWGDNPGMLRELGVSDES